MGGHPQLCALANFPGLYLELYNSTFVLAWAEPNRFYPVPTTPVAVCKRPKCNQQGSGRAGTSPIEGSCATSSSYYLQSGSGVSRLSPSPNAFEDDQSCLRPSFVDTFQLPRLARYQGDQRRQMNASSSLNLGSTWSFAPRWVV